MFAARPLTTVLIGKAGLTVALVAGLLVGAGGRAGAAGPTTYVRAERVCSTPSPGTFGCFAERLVKTTADSPGAKAFVAHPSLTRGPAGGYQPGSLATAYNINAGASTTQQVAIVDAYDDPNALADLNEFDQHYGMPKETSSSFKKVAQNGKAAPLPPPDIDWSVEISLDLQAVRGLCHKCSILLVEATSADVSNFAAAENTAVQLGATVVSNSFGGPETNAGIPNPIAAAFDHPGVVITASSGDDGMDNWDIANAGYASSNAPNYPASLNTVVAVGGTELTLNSSSQRQSESVWNENGAADNAGGMGPAGAAGGGCSTQVPVPRWQAALSVWSQTTCGTHRLASDISADADPETGLDVYDSFYSAGWQTVGGTSLASPLVAAMWAVAGGSAGVAYPALTLYGHGRSDPASVFDVTVGGNGFCDAQDATTCARNLTPPGSTPNTLGYGILDCAYLPNSATRSAGTRACDAAAGYDGPTGVGTPKGAGLFRPLKPVVSIGGPGAVTHGSATTFSAAAADPYPGGSVTAYRWSWGDGRTSTGAAPSHSWSVAGTYTVSVSATDSYQQTGTATRTVVVS